MAKINFGGVEENVVTREEYPLAKALENNDINEASETAHKMLPLFRLIKATQLVGQLQLLERTQSSTYTDALKQTSVSALTLINLIIKKAEHFMNSTQKD